MARSSSKSARGVPLTAAPSPQHPRALLGDLANQRLHRSHVDNLEVAADATGGVHVLPDQTPSPRRTVHTQGPLRGSFAGGQAWHTCMIMGRGVDSRRKGTDTEADTDQCLGQRKSWRGERGAQGAQSDTERHRATPSGTQKYTRTSRNRETQKDADKCRYTQRERETLTDAEIHRHAQRDAERRTQMQRDAESRRDTQRDTRGRRDAMRLRGEAEKRRN